jgi:hypothetical protein
MWITGVVRRVHSEQLEVLRCRLELDVGGGPDQEVLCDGQAAEFASALSPGDVVCAEVRGGRLMLATELQLLSAAAA